MMTLGSRPAALQDFERRSQARILQLLVQAAHREGLLSGCRFSEDQDQMMWRREGDTWRLPGRTYCGGDRLVLEWERWEGNFSQELEQLRIMADLPNDQAWKALLEESADGLEAQQAAYSACFAKQAPKEYLDFEGWTPEGHNLHPGAKTREGFTLEEQMDFAPEFTDRVELPWLSVARELLTSSGTLPAALLEQDGRYLVPVHPWQLKHQIPSIYPEEWSDGRLAVSSREPLACRPCTSLRTLVPYNTDFPVVKTSVGALMTSTERSMSRDTVLQGPVYNEYLKRIEARETELFARVTMMEELGGLCWHRSAPSSQARNLSLLFRARPPQMAPGHIAVPCSTLPQPTLGKVENATTYFEYFLNGGDGPMRQFEAYLRLFIPLHLQLYLKSGIGLEAHLQNCVLVWDQERRLQRLWIRDWGGLRADKERLKETAPDLFARLSGESVTLRDAATTEKKLLACLYGNHITELVLQAARAFQLAERELWSMVGEVTREALNGFEETTLARRLLEEPWPVKCLLRMRLGQGDGGDLYQLRANPLAER